LTGSGKLGTPAHRRIEGGARMSSDRNTYLEEVVAAQGQLEQDMRA